MSGGGSRSSSSDHYTIFTSAIGRVTEVRFYDETILHMRDQHPELRLFIPSLEHAVADTVRNPTRIHASNSELHSNSFKYVSSSHRLLDAELVAAVKLVEGTSAVLKTAYFTSNVSGEVIWTADGRNAER